MTVGQSSTKNMHVVLIGPDKGLLSNGSVSFERHRLYAQDLGSLHAIVFAGTEYGSERVTIAKHAWSYPTCSRSIPGFFIDAFRIGRQIITSSRSRSGWIISAQDPFESGLVAYALSMATGVPFMVQEHGDFFSEPHWRRESVTNRVRYFIGRQLLRRAVCVRVVSERIKRTLLSIGVRAERITVNPVCVDVASFQHAVPDERIAALRPEGGVLILTMARLVPQKNLTLLIRAFRGLIKEGVRARLVILGKGAERETLSAHAGDHVPEHITFLDWTDDPAGAMKAADIYALSSDYEGWGRVCIEALAAGTPLVMTDVGCAGEVVRNNENGLVVPVRDEVALTEALVRLARDPALRTRLAQAGVETVRRLPTNEESFSSYRKSLECCIVHAHADRKGDRHTKGAS